jgi:uncharacterized repeat protein (TIGR03917 family)
MTRGTDPHGAASGNTYTITIRPADRPEAVMRAWTALPTGVGFAEAFGDMDITLVFRSVNDLDPR